MSFSNCHWLDLTVAVGHITRNKPSLSDMLDILRDRGKFAEKSPQPDICKKKPVRMNSKNESTGMHTFFSALMKVK